MAAPCFIAWNAAVGALTGPPTAVASSATSGTSKTMLQIATASGAKIRIIEWGYTLTTTPGAPVQIELLDSGTVAATVTALTSAGVVKYNDATGGTSGIQLGTALSGYTATAEGSITSSRLLDYQYETGMYYKCQFPLGREPEIPGGDFLRIRVTPTTSAAISLSVFTIWEE